MDDEYALEIGKLAVARACAALGFKQCEKPVLDCLADVLQNYIRTLGTNAQDLAEVSGRVHAGIQDVLLVLDSTKPKGTNWKELRDFAFEDVKQPTLEGTSKWSQPFPFEVPSFPVSRPYYAVAEEDADALTGAESSTRDAFVPAHLPAYPPAHTYKRSLSKKRAPKNDAASESNRKAQRTAVRSAQQSLEMIENSIDA
ncbi:hypothetical protein B484DRAFT_450495 [Ochromonadaceae sp. CCMP2298]|nr:hypothetical protein B484DRAFT_450495 [Ochromonadaceae sp. CCMP2298]|mmetsp:Transcript_4959/g.11034  ORF Transcript_4959/g.11034 Transcript_4959/m.11034 type:complete len:199 (+) Transcript_4959:83-679(+)